MKIENYKGEEDKNAFFKVIEAGSCFMLRAGGCVYMKFVCEACGSSGGVALHSGRFYGVDCHKTVIPVEVVARLKK